MPTIALRPLVAQLTVLSRTAPRLWWSAAGDRVVFARFEVPVTRASPEAWCDEFVARFGPLFGLPANAERPAFDRVGPLDGGALRLRTAQSYSGVELDGASCELAVDVERGVASAIGSTLRPVQIPRLTTAELPVDQLVSAAENALRSAGYLESTEDVNAADFEDALWIPRTASQARQVVLLRTNLPGLPRSLFGEVILDATGGRSLEVRERKRLQVGASTSADDLVPAEAFDTVGVLDATRILDRGGSGQWVHATVETYSDVSREEIASLARDGTRLLERTGPTTWRASVRSEADSLLRLAFRNEIRSVTAVEWRDKVGPLCEEASRGPRGRRVAALVYVHADVALEQVRRDAARLPSVVVERARAALHTLDVTLDLDAVPQVAALDAVKWIELRPSVRSGTAAITPAASGAQSPEECREEVRRMARPIRTYLGLSTPVRSDAPAGAPEVYGVVFEVIEESLPGYLPPVDRTICPRPPGAPPQEHHGWWVAVVMAGKREPPGDTCGFTEGVAPAPEISQILSVPARFAFEGQVPPECPFTFEDLLKRVKSRLEEPGAGKSAAAVGNFSISPSFVTYGRCTPHDQTLDAWIAETGVPVTVAAGNLGAGSRVPTPGVAKNAVTVGAVDCEGTVLASTMHGTADERTQPELLAFGADVPYPSEPQDLLEGGTSFAAPAVAGLIALMLRRMPTGKDRPRPSTLKAILVATASPGEDYPAFGRVEGDAALAMANPKPGDPRLWHEIPLRTSDVATVQQDRWAAVSTHASRQEETRYFEAASGKTAPRRLVVSWDDEAGDPTAIREAASHLVNVVALRAVYVVNETLRVVSMTAADNTVVLEHPKLPDIASAEVLRLTMTFAKFRGGTVPDKQAISIAGGREVAPHPAPKVLSIHVTGVGAFEGPPGRWSPIRVRPDRPVEARIVVKNLAPASVTLFYSEGERVEPPPLEVATGRTPGGRDELVVRGCIPRKLALTRPASEGGGLGRRAIGGGRGRGPRAGVRPTAFFHGAGAGEVVLTRT